jgi:hypothetical protein
MRTFLVAAGIALALGGCTSTGGGSGNAADTRAEPLTAQMREDVAKQLASSIIFSSFSRGSMIYYEATIGNGGKPLFSNKEIYCVVARPVPANVSADAAKGWLWEGNTRRARVRVDAGKVFIDIFHPNSSGQCSIFRDQEPFRELERLSAKPDTTPPAQLPGR